MSRGGLNELRTSCQPIFVVVEADQFGAQILESSECEAVRGDLCGVGRDLAARLCVACLGLVIRLVFDDVSC